MLDEAAFHIHKCRAIRVIDGDTVICEIDLDFHVRILKAVRLGGIDAHETRTGSAEDRMQGAKAAARLTELVRANANGYVSTRLDPFDKYGRVLGRLFLGGLDINKTLVEEGLAKEIK